MEVSRICLLFIFGCALFQLAITRKHSRRDTENQNHSSDFLRGNERQKEIDQNKEFLHKIHQSENRNKDVVAKTQQGKYRGRVLQVSSGSKIAAFLGMRYAEPPLGKLRFKKPVSTKKWTGVRNAQNYPNTCFQWRDETFGQGYRGTEMWNPNTPLNEDCLFLNVWTPISSDFSGKRLTTSHHLLPVMFWIYGGAFYSGTSSLDVYDGKWLAATQQVVVVSLNYRVAALGFLTFGNSDSPGNVGLWDQNLALRWVHENIHHFGGDAERITLFGESAGAASVSLHMLSKHSNGLFQNAILQSASALSPWAILPPDVMIERATKLAFRVGCEPKHSNGTLLTVSEKRMEMLFCLQHASVQNLVNTEIAMEELGTARFQNAAIIDEDFLTTEDIDQLKNKKFTTEINVLAGFNGNEGNYFLVYSTPGFDIHNDTPISFEQYRSGVRKSLRGFPWNPKNGGYNSGNNLTNMLLDAIDFQYTDFETTILDRIQCSQQSQEQICGNIVQVKNNYKTILDHVVGDINFVCPVVDFLKKTTVSQDQLISTENTCPECMTSGKENTERSSSKYLYKFLHRSTQTPWPEWMGTLHGYEIEFAFGIPLDKGLNYTDEEIDLSKRMMRYWSNFAKSGNPNSPGNENGDLDDNLAYWPEYDSEKESSLVFNIKPIKTTDNKHHVVYYVEEQTKSKHCSFWNDYYPVIHRHVNEIVAGQWERCSKTNKEGNSAESLKISYSVVLLFLYTFLALQTPNTL